MGTQEFIIVSRYRLGASIYKYRGVCPACDRDNDVFGDHAILCGHEGDWIARHDHLRDAIHNQAAEVMLAPKKEERNLLEDTESRPADILILCWISEYINNCFDQILSLSKLDRKICIK